MASSCVAFHPTMSIGQDFEAHTHEFAEAMTDPRTHEAIRRSAEYLLELTYKLFTDDALLARIKEEHFQM